jgi:HPr kinase/phosphorylase
MTRLNAGATRVHATALALGQKAVLIQGPSGSGKSDLALRCLALAPSPLIPASPLLIADDQVELTLKECGIWLEAPPTILGKLEVRGLGIITLNPAPATKLALIVNLLAPNRDPERLPDPQSTQLLGHAIPTLELQPFETSAALKLLLALQFA